MYSMFYFDGNVVDLQVGLRPAPEVVVLSDFGFDLVGFQFPPDAVLNGLFIYPTGELAEGRLCAAIHGQSCQSADRPFVTGIE